MVKLPRNDGYFEIALAHGASGMLLHDRVTLTGMRIDISTKRPIIRRNNIKRFSGKCAAHCGARLVLDALKVKIPIVGLGSTARADAGKLLAGDGAADRYLCWFDRPVCAWEDYRWLN